MTMKPLTVEDMLQIGHGCGLVRVEEAYNNVMNHYDCFFPIEGFGAARSAFDKLCIEAHLTEEFKDETGSGRRFRDLAIVDAAKELGIVLRDDEPQAVGGALRVRDKPLTLDAKAPRHVIGALERQILRLDEEAKKMADAGNYDCMFPEGDAESLREVVAILRTLPVGSVERTYSESDLTQCFKTGCPRCGWHGLSNECDLPRGKKVGERGYITCRQCGREGMVVPVYLDGEMETLGLEWKPERIVPEKVQLPMLDAVVAELERAVLKFPEWPDDPVHASLIVAEEAGELHKAVLECTYEPHKCDVGEVEKEAIQTAAMAFRFLASLSKYVYKKSPQHKQDALVEFLRNWKAGNMNGR